MMKVPPEAMDLLERLLVLDPKQRLPVSAVLKHSFFKNLDVKSTHGYQKFVRSLHAD